MEPEKTLGNPPPPTVRRAPLSRETSLVRYSGKQYDAFACACTRRRHDGLHCSMVLEKPGLLGRRILLRATVWHVVCDKRRGGPHEYGMRAATTTPLCGVLERRVKIPVGIWACKVLVQGNRPRQHDANSNQRSLRLGSSSFFVGKTRESDLNAPDKWQKPTVPCLFTIRTIATIGGWVPLIGAFLCLGSATIGGWVPLLGPFLCRGSATIGGWVPSIGTFLCRGSATIGGWVPLFGTFLCRGSATIGGWVPFVGTFLCRGSESLAQV